MIEKNFSKIIEDYLQKMNIDPSSVILQENTWLIHQKNSSVCIMTIGGFIIFQSPIMHCPKQNVQTFYRKLLELNENAEETLGASFGINSHNEIMLKFLYPIQNMDFDTFSYLLTSIAHVADKQSKELKEKFDF
ncbi:MAG: YbjN domain-containing protein [Deltaproteobacteria bacterium]|nr:YbjN domain-containing protein [Deltaproteobacteria bacterium]